MSEGYKEASNELNVRGSEVNLGRGSDPLSRHGILESMAAVPAYLDYPCMRRRPRSTPLGDERIWER